MDKDLKQQADQIFNAMGMSLTTAITVFVRQAVTQRRIPFEITLSDSENRTLAMREALTASERIWQNAAENNTDTLTLEAIDAEIVASRAKRRSQSAKA
jgi:DNA-damage-inducible protein J